jgi:predicted TIM-barrel fold metal-dependent hydrolase
MSVSESQRQTYLNHARDITDAERAKIDEFAAWLPPAIIDAHAHSNLPEHVLEVPPKAYNHMLSTFPSFSIEESHALQAEFYPGVQVRTLRFAKTFKGIAHVAANSYLLDNLTENDRMALYGLPDDIPYTIDMLQDPRVSGLKMYYSYLDPSASSIYEIFKPEILEAAQANGVPIILHTPKMITESADDVLNMAKDFPDLKVSIAHLGSSKFDVPALQDAYDKLAEGTDVLMDTALNPSEEVVKRALDTFGPDRIMFGSDEPLNLLRSVPYIHPEHGQRITTSQRYHWQNPAEQAEYGHLADGALHSHWLCLDALRKVIDAVPGDTQENVKHKIFHDNAELFFGFDTSTEVE